MFDLSSLFPFLMVFASKSYMLPFQETRSSITVLAAFNKDTVTEAVLGGHADAAHV